MLISSRFPIGVDTIYRPGFIKFIFIFFIFINSCTSINYPFNKDDEIIKGDNIKKKANIDQDIIKKPSEQKITLEPEKLNISDNIMNQNIDKTISIILPQNDDTGISEQFVNVTELAIYNKKLKDISFDINLYTNSDDLINIVETKIKPGKIFVGPLDSAQTKLMHKYCNEGAIFFSFSSNTELAKECVFLVNFFPKNELETLFNYFPLESKIAILYPENSYGYKINNLIDEIADKSNSVIINRASYKTDLSNVRDSIKELGKYELRKYELDRQKKLLTKKGDVKSIKRLKKLEKFQTTKDFEFTHIILPDYGLRLLQVAPLLAYYDIDPNIVKFVGTGVWDDQVFFTEPSLQNAIFPGVEISKRKQLIKDYSKIYQSKLMRTSTLPYDLIGLFSYMYDNKMTLSDFYDLLKNDKNKFDGIDGGFYFQNNIIERTLSILKIENGKAKKIN